MARKKFFLTVDTETTITDKVADLGLVVSDKQGNVEREYGLLVREFFLSREDHPLFHDYTADPLWGKRHLPRRYAAYDEMLTDGRRMLASVAAINRLLIKIRLKYDPTWTAYNKAFDAGKLSNSGIDMSIFSASFCLWHASVAKWGQTRAFRDFVCSNHMFGKRTAKGNMSMKTNAEAMAAFVLGLDPDANVEPHTALEDARDFELPILTRLVQTTSPRDYMNPPGYNWRHWQLKDHFRSK